jgi:hypothetical protein
VVGVRNDQPSRSATTSNPATTLMRSSAAASLISSSRAIADCAKLS